MRGRGAAPVSEDCRRHWWQRWRRPHYFDDGVCTRCAEPAPVCGIWSPGIFGYRCELLEGHERTTDHQKTTTYTDGEPTGWTRW